MKFKSNFLTLSIREQICIVIIILSFLCFLVVLCLSCSFCYETLKEDYKQKKLIFYDKYKEFIESSLYFQNFILLQYEEIIKRMQMELYKYHHNSMPTYLHMRKNFKNITEELIPLFNTKEHKYISENNEAIFTLCYHNSINCAKNIRLSLSSIYDSLSSLVFTHDIDKFFRVPSYDLPILKSPIGVCPDYKMIFSYNGSYIYKTLRERHCNYTDNETYFELGDLDNYFNMTINKMKADIFDKITKYLSNSLFCFNHMFEKSANDMIQLDEVQNILRSEYAYTATSFNDYLAAVSGYYSSIHLETNKFELISNYKDKYYYFEANMISDYLFFIHKKLSIYLNMTFIPIYKQNNTIISPELCLQFLLKQYNYQLDENQINGIYNNLTKGVSHIIDCFKDKDLFRKQEGISNIFALNITNFSSADNILHQGIIGTPEYGYYYIKYSFPNYNTLKDFRSDYLLLEQINFYLFASFKEPVEFSRLVLQMNKNLFYLIVIIILFTWIICLFVNLFFFNKVIFQLTEPIKKLQEAIESSSIKDDTIFNYEYDEFINDLFLTSKELLSGQIDNNNEKGLGQFNIISIPNEKKKIDKKLYQRNLIINNDIMNQLISVQQNMMDFSNNIQTNYFVDKDCENNEGPMITKKVISNKLYENKLKLNSDDYIKEKDKDNDNMSNKKNKNKSDEEKGREPYKKLFKISEYLFYYQNKSEKNYIHIINNSIKDESKNSNISKISSNINPNGSLNISSKLKKTIIRGDSYGKTDDNDNITINMLKNKNISYLWYMEAKKNKNKSLNYQINVNYDELFNEYNTFNTNNEIMKKKF